MTYVSPFWLQSELWMGTLRLGSAFLRIWNPHPGPPCHTWTEARHRSRSRGAHGYRWASSAGLDIPFSFPSSPPGNLSKNKVSERRDIHPSPHNFDRLSRTCHCLLSKSTQCRVSWIELSISWKSLSVKPSWGKLRQWEGKLHWFITLSVNCDRVHLIFLGQNWFYKTTAARPLFSNQAAVKILPGALN